MTAAKVKLVVEQGSDFLIQIHWADQNNVPMHIEPPLRMEIQTADTRQVQLALQGGDSEGDESYQIVWNADNGIIQISIDAEQTKQIPAGMYIYDLFVGYSDLATSSVRRHRLIEGQLEVRGRVTKNV